MANLGNGRNAISRINKKSYLDSVICPLGLMANFAACSAILWIPACAIGVPALIVHGFAAVTAMPFLGAAVYLCCRWFVRFDRAPAVVQTFYIALVLQLMALFAMFVAFIANIIALIFT